MTNAASSDTANAISDKPWLLYGANGYTGELIAREAVRRGMRPVLAGRSKDKIKALAQELKCEWRTFTVEDQTATLVAMEGVSAVLNCAGPFSQTAGLMMQACLALHIHYLDIAGEIDVFELAHSLDAKAQRARMVLLPGVGFDVVPTDCVAARLQEVLPDATHLALAFESNSRSSIGTAKTGIESLGFGNRVRKNGQIISLAFGSLLRSIDFGEGVREAVAIPWGDVSTAFHTTGIPNVEVYLGGPAGTAKRMRRANTWGWLLRRSLIKWMLKRQVSKGPRGPNQTERDCNPTFIWGEVRNAAGIKKVARLKTANGYAVTQEAALAILCYVLAQDNLNGFYTPAKLMGAQFAESLTGSSTLRIE